MTGKPSINNKSSEMSGGWLTSGRRGGREKRLKEIEASLRAQAKLAAQPHQPPHRALTDAAAPHAAAPPPPPSRQAVVAQAKIEALAEMEAIAEREREQLRAQFAESQRERQTNAALTASLRTQRSEAETAIRAAGREAMARRRELDGAAAAMDEERLALEAERQRDASERELHRAEHAAGVAAIHRAQREAAATAKAAAADTSAAAATKRDAVAAVERADRTMAESIAAAEAAADARAFAAEAHADGMVKEMAAAVRSGGWEWEENDASWKPYDAAASAALDEAWLRFTSSDGAASVTVLSDRYTVDFATWQQTRSDTGGQRAVRRLASPFEVASSGGGSSSAGGASSSLPEWSPSTPATPLGGGGATVRTLTSASAGSLARESMEWNVAKEQFMRLSGGGSGRVVAEVDVYSCPAVEACFAACKTEFTRRGVSTHEIWVFHGTAPANVRAIMTSGFKVGGRDTGVGVAHGVVHGHGVYTAKGPAVPMGYTNGGNEVILARALQGQVGAQEASDCWGNGGSDWAIFREGKQLLPRYVVRFR